MTPDPPKPPDRLLGVLDLLLSKHEVFPKHNVLKRAQFI